MRDPRYKVEVLTEGGPGEWFGHTPDYCSTYRGTVTIFLIDTIQEADDYCPPLSFILLLELTMPVPIDGIIIPRESTHYFCTFLMKIPTPIPLRLPLDLTALRVRSSSRSACCGWLDHE